MSMLAEPRRKPKWSLDPRGKRWSEDSNKFGQKMLEKMGWSNGKGLGVNEQGITNHVKLPIKNNKTGIGYDKSLEKEWVEHQEKFNEFLQELQKYEDQEVIQKERDDNENQSGQSLELKSKQSRARLHYKKFTRSKDVSTYSSKDLSNIFGQKVSTDKTQVMLEKDDSTHEKETVGTSDNKGGVVTVNSGSMVDYFKHKLSNHKKSLSSNMTNNLAINSKKEIEQPTDFKSKAENTLQSTYGIAKDFCEKNDYIFDNPCLGLNNSIDIISNNDSSKISTKKRKKEFMSENTIVHIDEMHKLNTKKKLKTEISDNDCRNGFTNPALNLAIESNGDYNGKEFEVSRAQFGLENCCLDLTDEKSNKKRVTFNDHVEYSIDSTKKKKEKATLDKFEVENKKLKKKRKHESITAPVSNGFVNEALDIEMLCEEINDNEWNECKSKKIKKRKICKTSNLETIQESPEQEKEITKVQTEDIVLNTCLVENEKIDNANRKLKKKKKKNKKAKVEDITVVEITSEEAGIEIEEVIKDKKIKLYKNKEETILEKRKKEKRKDKKSCETEFVKDVIKSEISSDEQNIEILEKTDLEQQQNDNSVKNKNDTFKDTAQVEIPPIITIEKKEKISLEKIKKKKNEENTNSKSSQNEINMYDLEKKISDKENASQEQDSNVKILSKKDKKHKKSKDNNIESSSNSSIKVANANISKEENAQFIDTPSNQSKMFDATDGIIHIWNGKTRMSKKMLKTLFYKNLSDFPGSNIHEIKGYGVDIDNS